MEGDVGSASPTDLIQALVPRPRDDGVVAGSEDDVGETEDRLLRAAEDEDLLGRDPLIERGDLGPQERMTAGLRIAEPEVAPEALRLLVCELEQVRHRVALDVRGAEKVLDGELPASKIAFEGEIGDPHRPILGDASSPRLKRSVRIAPWV